MKCGICVARLEIYKLCLTLCNFFRFRILLGKIFFLSCLKSSYLRVKSKSYCRSQVTLLSISTLYLCAFVHICVYLCVCVPVCRLINAFILVWAPPAISHLNSLHFHHRKQMIMRSMASSRMIPSLLALTEQGTGLINFSSGSQVRENTSYSCSPRDWVPPLFMRPLNSETSASRATSIAELEWSNVMWSNFRFKFKQLPWQETKDDMNRDVAMKVLEN